MQDEVVEKAEPDREHQEIEEQRLDDNRRRARLGCAQERNEGSDEANEEKSKGEVAKYEPDRIAHRCAERRLDPLELLQVCEAVEITLVEFARRLERSLQ